MRKLFQIISVIVLFSFITTQTAEACWCCCHIFHAVTHAVSHVAKTVANTVTHPKAIVKAVVKVTTTAVKDTAKVAKVAAKATVKVAKTTVKVAIHPIASVKSVGSAIAHPKDTLNSIKNDAVKIEEKAVHTAAQVADGALKSGLVKGVAGSVGLSGVVKAVDKGVTMADGMNEMVGSKLGVKAHYIPAGMRVPGQAAHKKDIVKNSPDVLAKYAQQEADAKATIKQLMTLDEASAIATIDQNILNAKVIDNIDGATMVAIMILVARSNEAEYGKFLEWLSHDDLQHHNMNPVLIAMTKIAPDLGVAATYALKETELADQLTNQIKDFKQVKVDRSIVATSSSADNKNTVPAVTEKPHSLIGDESIQEQPHSLIGNTSENNEQPRSLINGYDSEDNSYGNGESDGVEGDTYYDGGVPEESYQNDSYPSESYQNQIESNYPSEEIETDGYPSEEEQLAQARDEGFVYGESEPVEGY